jgi:hypothetical protein
MSVRTAFKLYQFVVSCTALYPLAYVLVLAHTSTYHLVPPCTRGTGFQMTTRLSSAAATRKARIDLKFLSSIIRVRVRVIESYSTEYYVSNE